MPLLLVLIFLVLPVVELYVLVQVGQLIGVPPAIALLVAVSVLGAWLVKREGVRAWRAFLAAARGGRVPAREAADGALVLFGGALLLTPGFVTDALGLALLLPPTRAVVRRALLAVTMRRFPAAGVAGMAASRFGRTRRPRPRVVDADVIDAEIIRETRNPRASRGGPG